MPKPTEKLLLTLTDFIFITATFLVWAMIRWTSGQFAEPEAPQLLVNALILAAIWILIFLFFGLYRPWYAQSRTDEFISVLKTISIGVFIIFLITLEPSRDAEDPLPPGRLMIFTYWFLMVLGVGAGRLSFRTIQRKLLEAGKGLRPAVIVGWNQKGRELFDRVNEFPALGYRVVGFVDDHVPTEGGDYKDLKVLGDLGNINEVLERHKVAEVLIALEEDVRERALDVISACDGLAVRFKIQPDLQDLITGRVKTNQLYGFPLIEIMPELMPAWEKRVKRLIDVALSVVLLVGFLPVWLLVAVAIKLESRGPVLFSQERVGKEGKVFKMHKFRSMVQDAEKQTGPVWAGERDPRITRLGLILRKLRIDEIPQFINVLQGNMSLVGPRPERPFFVEKFKKEIPLYARRLTIQPGITGWGQVICGYDSSIEDVKKKLEYDLYYIENMSLRMDLKIVLNTVYVMLVGRGQ